MVMVLNGLNRLFNIIECFLSSCVCLCVGEGVQEGGRTHSSCLVFVLFRFVRDGRDFDGNMYSFFPPSFQFSATTNQPINLSIKHVEGVVYLFCLFHCFYGFVS